MMDSAFFFCIDDFLIFFVEFERNHVWKLFAVITAAFI